MLTANPPLFLTLRADHQSTRAPLPCRIATFGESEGFDGPGPDTPFEWSRKTVAAVIAATLVRLLGRMHLHTVCSMSLVCTSSRSALIHSVCAAVRASCQRSRYWRGTSDDTCTQLLSMNITLNFCTAGIHMWMMHPSCEQGPFYIALFNSLLGFGEHRHRCPFVAHAQLRSQQMC